MGPLLRDGRVSLYLRDPDNVSIELTAANDQKLTESDVEELGRNLPGVTAVTSGMRLTTFDHASPVSSDPKLTARFFEKFVGLKDNFSLPAPDQGDATILAIGNAERPDFIRYLASERAREGYVGRGSVHHIAWRTADDAQQLDGNLLEVATKGPGYTADESRETLGSRLVLPKWVEPRRTEIEAFLRKTDAGNPVSWPPVYPLTPKRPEALTQSN